MAFKIGGEFNLKGNASSQFTAVGSALRGVQNTGQQVSNVLGRTTSSLNTAGRSASSAGGQAQSGARGFTTMGQAAQRAGNLAQRAAKQAGDAWKTTANTLRGARDGIMSVFNLPNALLTGGAVLAGKSVIDAVGYKEQQLISFNTMLKNTTLGLGTYKYALKFAAETPFETPGVVEASKKLLSFGFNLKQLPGLLRTTGDAASGLSLGEEGFQRLGVIFGQVKSKGKLQGDELLQLDEMGLGVRDALKAAYAGLDFNKILSKGQIRADDALGIIQRDLDKRFGGMMKKQSQSIFGLVSTLKSRPFELFQSLDADKELAPVKNVLANLATITDFDANPIGKKIKNRFVKGIGGLFTAAFGPLASSTDPNKVGAYIDKIFDKLDVAGAWLAKNGPGLVKGFGDFFGGIGDTINAVRSSIEWMSGMSGKFSGALEMFGLIQDSKFSGRSSRSGHLLEKPAGFDMMRTGGGLLAGAVGLKFVNGLLGGVPWNLAKGLLGKLTGGLIGGKAGGLLGGVQKVFVVNMGAGGLGGIGDMGGMLKGGRATSIFGKGLQAVGRSIGWVFKGMGQLGLGLLRLGAAWLVGLGPIGWVTLAIAGIGAGLVLAYNKVAWFRNGVNAAWKGIKLGGMGLLGWFQSLPGSIMGALSSLPSLMQKLGSSMWESMPKPLKDGLGWIGNAANSAGNAIGGALSSAGNMLTGNSGGNFTDLGGDTTIATTARDALNASWSEQAAGFCSRFVRQVFEKSIGSKTNGLFGASAIESENLWKNAGLTRSVGQIKAQGGLKPGDVLFQGFGSKNAKGKAMGHIGIVTVDPRTGKLAVAENTTRYGESNDNRHLTPLERFGRVTSVGRYGAGGGEGPTAASPASFSSGGMGGTNGMQISITFGDIVVNGATPQSAAQIAAAVKSQTRAAAEQAVLEAFERLASRIGGAGGLAA